MTKCAGLSTKNSSKSSRRRTTLGASALSATKSLKDCKWCETEYEHENHLRQEARLAASVGRTTRRKSRAAATASVGGKRLGTKKRDMRWQDPDGNIWASKFEYGIYAALKEQGYDVFKTGEQDSLRYTSDVRSGLCLECGARRVVQERTYTPDLFVHSRTEANRSVRLEDRRGYYLEAKGYLRADRRRLLREFRKANPNIDLRLVAQRDYKVGKGTLTSWATKYLKVPVHVWNGALPPNW